MTAANRKRPNRAKFICAAIMRLSLICLMAGFGFSCRRSSDFVNIDLLNSKPGEWVNLLPDKSLQGWWQDPYNAPDAITVKAQAFQFAEGTPFTAISWDGQNFPTENYEVEVTAMRLSGRDIFCGLLFPVGETFVTMVLGGWANAVVGLSCIDELFAADNETAVLMSFNNDQWYHVLVRVTEDKIQAWIDDKQVIDLKREGRKITPYPGLEHLAPFGLFSWMTTASLRDLRVRLL